MNISDLKTKTYSKEAEFEKDIRKVLRGMEETLVIPKVVSINELGIADVLFTYKGTPSAWELKLNPFNIQRAKCDSTLNHQINWLFSAHIAGWTTGFVSPSEVEDYFVCLKVLQKRLFPTHWIRQYFDNYGIEENN